MRCKYWLATIGFILMISIPGTILHVFGADTWDEYNLINVIDSDYTISIYDDTHYIYEPKPDITIYEIALIFPIFIYAAEEWAVLMIEGLPPEAKRHFRKEE